LLPFFVSLCCPPASLLFPYTTLFRSGGQPRPAPTIFLVDILHHLFAPLMLEIDVDIGRLVALGGDEAAKDQLGLSRVNLGDPEADRKSTRLNSSHVKISYAVFCLKKK